MLGEQLGQVLAIDIWVASNLGGQVPGRGEALLAVEPGHGGGGGGRSRSGEAETRAGRRSRGRGGVVAVVCGWGGRERRGEERWKGSLL